MGLNGAEWGGMGDLWGLMGMGGIATLFLEGCRKR